MATEVKITKAKVTAALKALGIDRGTDFESLVIAPGENVVRVHRTLTEPAGATESTEYEIK